MRTLLLALITLAAAGWPAAAASFTPYTPAAFEQAVASGKPVVVHVHADWCPVCQRQKPILGALLAEPDFAGVEAIEVNFDRDRDILARLGVTSQATVLVIRDGAIVASSVYQTDPAALRQTLLGGL